MADFFDSLLTIDQAAKVSPLSRSSIEKLRAQRKVTFVRVGLRSYFLADVLQKELRDRQRVVRQAAS